VSDVEPRDGGYATVWVVAAIAVVVVAASVAIGIGVATLERHRAGSAADSVALQVALDALQGQSAACQAGGVLAGRNGAVVTHCALDGSIAEVEVAVPLPDPLRFLGPATGHARAGPVSMTSPR
jgi:secretion/DNA translocation related TadE-like protein